MIPYIAHASILIAGSFILYWILLRKETFYQLNRTFLLFSVILSLALPLIVMPENLSFRNSDRIDMPTELNTEVSPENPVVSSTVINKNVELSNIDNPNQELQSIAEKPIANTPEGNSNKNDEAQTIAVGSSFISKLETWWHQLNLKEIVWTIYFIGVAIFMLTFLIQFCILFIKKSKLEFIQDGKYRIYELTDDSSPFSFLTWIFINPALYDFDTYNQIIEHEKIHVKQAHYADKFVAELAVIFFWFNPFVWMYRTAITNNLEFLTDEEMLGKGTDKESYQMSLLRVSVPQHALNLTTNYNESFLSARIKMMNNKKSSAKSSWKYLLILPLIAFSLATLNGVNPVENEQAVETSIDENNEGKNDLVLNQENTEQITTNTKADSQSDDSSETKDQSNQESSAQPSSTQTRAENAIASSSTNGAVEKTKRNNSDESKDSDKFHEGKWHSNEDDIFQRIQPGYWEAIIGNDEVCFHINNSDLSERWVWTMHECFPINEIRGFNVNSEVELNITRDPGTLNMLGEFSKHRGAGTFQFIPDQSFKTYLNSKGIAEVSDRNLLQMFLNKSDKDFVQTVLSNNASSTIKDLVNLGIHQVDGNKYKEYLRIFKSIGDDRRSNKDIINMAIHGVDESFVKSLLRINSFELSPKDLINAKIHDLRPEMIQDLIDYGYSDLSIKSVTNLAIHNFHSDELAEIKSLGYDNLSVKDLADFAIHGVNLKFIKDLSGLGYKDLSGNDLVKFAIHDVNVRHVKALKDLGYENLEAKTLINTLIHDINPDFIKDVNDNIGQRVSIEQLTNFSIHGVDGRYISELREAGLKNMTAKEFVKARIHGISPRFVRSLYELDLCGINFKSVQDARIHDVSIGYLKGKLESSGEEKCLPQFIKQKILGY